ncbi:MAG: hypothetical protein RBS80_13165 [Thermoguttaceae bacterium]|jgi:endonuclease-3|nr:hypothetical protein [Thermoguttaceae bacterium]
MASESRTTQFASLHKVLKKHYKPVAADSQRSVLEHLLFACTLEGAHYEPAEESFAGLVHTFFDWNEVRVTSIAELAEVMASLPDPRRAAYRIKRVLHSLFEDNFTFDLESLRKQNLGPTIQWLEKLEGTDRFVVAYTVQAALGGHAIALDDGTLQALLVVDLATEEEVAAGMVSGLERAIPKAKGIEFGSLLHQLGADFAANPYSPKMRGILLEVNPDCERRFPKRRDARKARSAAKKAASAGSDSATADDAAKSAPPADSAAKAPPAAGKKKESKQDSAAESKSAADKLGKRKPR